LKHFRSQQEWMAEKIDFSVDVHGPDTVRSVVDSPLFHAAKVEHVGAGLQPAKYVYGMGVAVARRGVTIVEGARATSIERQGGGFVVETSRGRIRAGQLLMATNGYTDDRMCWTNRRFLNYFRRTHDNRMLMGGRQNLSTNLDLAESGEILKARTLKVFPQLEGYSFEYSWNGQLGVTFDLMPHIGKLDGVWYALGYGGHGVGVASLVGAHVGRLIGGSAERSAFAEIPHPIRPYYREKTWFLPFAAPLYRTLDRLGR
jgi:glycine/D-amino acid oxidase-like deaminating enzyme